MSLLWPGFLYCLELVPLIILAYVWGIHRRRRYAARMSSLSLVREAARNQSQWRRHLPFSFFLVAVISLIVAACRPVIKMNVPSKQGIIILALDVSRSMCSTDIGPTRLQALEGTLHPFIAAQSPSTRIGIVAFSDFAELTQPPTDDRTALYQAIDGLMTGPGRAIGDGLSESLEVLAEKEGGILAGDPTPAVIILVTDGANTVGPSPLDAAALAAERGIRIYTVGLSSPSGPVDTSCQSSDPSGFGETSGGGGSGPGGVDAKTLKRIAALTGARYFPASGLSGLKNVFQDAQLRDILVSEAFEVTVAFVALGGSFAMIAFLMALVWRPVIPIDVDQRFRNMSTTESGGWRPLIPMQAVRF